MCAFGRLVLRYRNKKITHKKLTFSYNDKFFKIHVVLKRQAAILEDDGNDDDDDDSSPRREISDMTLSSKHFYKNIS